MLDRLLILSIAFTIVYSPLRAQFSYISPEPGSKMQNKETGIILRTGNRIVPSSLRAELFSITGTISGKHEATVKLAPDGQTILITPIKIFSGGETIRVNVKPGIMNMGGYIALGRTFDFEIKKDLCPERQHELNEAVAAADEDYQVSSTRNICAHIPGYEINSIPGAYCDEPLFYMNWIGASGVSDCWRTTILSSGGDSIYAHHNNQDGFDFKINENGYITYFGKDDSVFKMLDSSYNLVKTFQMGNGYKANKHEFRVYPNGNYFMQNYDGEVVDMSQYGGQPDANVIGVVIQELDSDNNVIFQWRSWDHFQITDAANDIVLTAGTVEYVHSNSMELDSDGNLLLSCRNMDEITKINLSTGDIMWRMGGKNNQFTFINDPDSPKPFSHQHHIRRLPNGHFTMFDNGNYQSIERSTAKEFVIDEVNKSATLVWSFTHPQVNGYNVFGSSLGSVEKLSNGNHFIDWGQISGNVQFAHIPNFSEVDSNGNVVWEFRFLDSTFVSYRAYKEPWDRCNLIPDSSLIADSITNSSAGLHWKNNSKFSGFILQYKECGANSWTSIPLTANFYNLSGLTQGQCYEWRITSVCTMYGDSAITLSHQFITLNPLQVVDANAANSFFTLYPNPSKDHTTLDFYSGESGKTEIIIYDLPGAEVYRDVIFTQKGINKVMLNLKSISTGQYLLDLNQGEVNRYCKLIVQ